MPSPPPASSTWRTRSSWPRTPPPSRTSGVNITGGLKTLAYSIFGQSYNPATDPNTLPYDLATVFNSIAANWNYAIPNNPSDLSQGYHPVLYVAANSGVYMSTDNGQTWSLFPDTTYGAVAEGGDLPHVNVTDLSLSQGNIAVATGMPALAGPYQTFTFTGTLTERIDDRHGHHQHRRSLAVGDVITGTRHPGRDDDHGRQQRRTTASPSRTRRRPAARRASPPPIPRPPRTPTSCWPAPTARAPSPSTWRRCSSTGTTQIDPTDTGGAALRRHPDRHDRHAHHRRPQRDHRLRQHHLGHDRRRDPGRLDLRAGHRRVRPATSARPVDHGQLEQLDRRLRQLRHPGHRPPSGPTA